LSSANRNGKHVEISFFLIPRPASKRGRRHRSRLNYGGEPLGWKGLKGKNSEKTSSSQNAPAKKYLPNRIAELRGKIKKRS